MRLPPDRRRFGTDSRVPARLQTGKAIKREVILLPGERHTLKLSRLGDGIDGRNTASRETLLTADSFVLSHEGFYRMRNKFLERLLRNQNASLSLRMVVC